MLQNLYSASEKSTVIIKETISAMSKIKELLQFE